MPATPARALLRSETRRARRRTGAAPPFDGPPPVLPVAVDRALERWWRLPPRMRAAAVIALLVVVAAGAVLRVARSPYGPPVPVVVAVRDLAVGAAVAGAVAPEHRPADHVPSDAVATVPPDATLAMGVVSGTVLTARHLRPGGPLADLAAGSAAVAVPVDIVPGAVPGLRVDLVATLGDGSGAVVAADARVLAVTGDLVWFEVPRVAAPDVAAAASRGLLTAALLAG